MLVHDLSQVDAFPLKEQFVGKHGFFPSITYFHNISYSIVQHLKDKYTLLYKGTSYNHEATIKRYEHSHVIEVRPGVWMDAYDVEWGEKSQTQCSVSILHALSEDISDLIKEIGEFNYIEKKRKIRTSEVSIVGNRGQGLTIEQFAFKAPKLKIALNYGEAFLEKHKPSQTF